MGPTPRQTPRQLQSTNGDMNCIRNTGSFSLCRSLSKQCIDNVSTPMSFFSLPSSSQYCIKRRQRELMLFSISTPSNSAHFSVLTLTEIRITSSAQKNVPKALQCLPFFSTLITKLKASLRGISFTFNDLSSNVLEMLGTVIDKHRCYPDLMFVPKNKLPLTGKKNNNFLKSFQVCSYLRTCQACLLLL